MAYCRQFVYTNLQLDTDVVCRSAEPGMSFNATSSTIVVGQTEIEQYKRSIRNKAKRANFSSLSEYSYNVTVIEQRPTTEGIFIRIEEHHSGGLTHGGSSFMVTSDHIGKEQCPYRDMFNGTYLSWCSPMTLRERRTIVISLEYVNFAAFSRWRPPSFGLVIYHSQFRLDKTTAINETLTPLRSPLVTAVLESHARKEDVVLWYKDHDTWRVKVANGDHFLSLSAQLMCDCITKMGRLILMGSSHMRYKFSYIAYQCFNITGVGFTGNREPVGNVHYYQFFRSENFTHSFKRYLKDIQLVESDVLLVQTGAHDLAGVGGLSSFVDTMATYVDALVAARKGSKVLRRNFVVVTPPPFPMHATGMRMTGDRNNFCIAASVNRLKQLLAKHEFEIFDEFSILRPVSERDLCTGHYICPMSNGGTYGVYGDVGFAAVRLMISHVCKANTRWLAPPCQ